MKDKHYLQWVAEKGYRIDKDGILYDPTGKRKSGYVDNKGYLRYSIRISNYIYALLFHRLQAYQKFGDKMFENKICVRHLNNYKLDNSWNNIDIGTDLDNMRDNSPETMEKIRDAARKASLNAGLSKSPLSEEDVFEIRRRVASGVYGTYKKLAQEYGLKSAGTISDIVNLHVWRHIL